MCIKNLTVKMRVGALGSIILSLIIVVCLAQAADVWAQTTAYGDDALGPEVSKEKSSSDTNINKTPSQTEKSHAISQPGVAFLDRLQSWMDSSPSTQDIDPKLFKDFWLKWELVTTRYKTDNEELRFIYVNKIGADALAKGIYPFPEGTVFAKIGSHAAHDPIFDSSLIPGRIVRVQVMLKKTGDPKARDGWVYSLYMLNHAPGQLTTDEIDACQACHVVAKSRDMVFSQPFPSPFGAAPAREDVSSNFQQSFKKTATNKLSAKLRELVRQLSPNTQTVMWRNMPAFIGTLDESREVLAGFARTSHFVYALASADEKDILIAAPGDRCAALIIQSENDKKPRFLQSCLEPTSNNQQRP